MTIPRHEHDNHKALLGRAVRNNDVKELLMLSAWSASIDHPDLADWVTVAAYIFAAGLSARAAYNANLMREPRTRVFWQTTTALMIFLGINELIDLQTLLTMLGREHAKTTGWYFRRREVQYLFIIGLTAFTIIFGIMSLWLIRRAHFTVHCAAGGLAFIGLFVLFRAASFHHMDEILGSGFKMFNLGSIQELVGVGIVAAAARIYARRKPRTQHGY